MGQYYASYIKHISKSYSAKKSLACNLCSEWSQVSPWNKPDHQKTEYSGYIIIFLNPNAFYQ